MDKTIISEPATQASRSWTSRMARRSLLIATSIAAVTGSLVGSASAQVLLYENRLPDGYAYVRFVNTLADTLTVKPAGFADDLTLGKSGTARISPYYTVEKVAGRNLGLDLVAGSATGHTTFELKPGAFHTVLIERDGTNVATKVVADESEVNQTRARLAFYNAMQDCGTAGLQLEPAGTSVFSGVSTGAMRGRSVNPIANAHVRAACGTHHVAPLALGELSAGGQYSIWLMAPSGSPEVFMSENTIAPYLR